MAKKRKLTPTPRSTPVSDPAEQETSPPVKQEPIDDQLINDPIDDDTAMPADSSPPDSPLKDEEDSLMEDDEKPQIQEDTEAPAADQAPDGNLEEEEADNDPAAIQKLLDPLAKDQLADLLRDAAVKHPDVFEQIVRVADSDPSHRKIFVHGLGWDTTTEDLIAAFSSYGEIEDSKAVKDKATGKSKGYGFILFKHRSGARRALVEPQKKIGNRMTACQLASAGPVPPPNPPVSEYTQRKIYVSNVGADLDPQKVMQYFAKFGEIEEGPLGLDKGSGKFKGFCLFVYKAAESAKKALEEPHKNFEGHVLHCQKAIDGPKPNKPGFGSHLPGSAGGHGSHFPRNGNAGMMGGHGPPGRGGHLMAPSSSGMGYNQGAPPAASAAAAAGLTPALGQALTAFLATQGVGLGLTNLLGAANQAGGPPQHGMNPGGMGGYGAQGGYGNMPPGPGGRNQGHMGGHPPYMGR